MVELILLSLCSGLAMPLGAQLATYEHWLPDWLDVEFRHSVTAFGGGALLSAVALVLVPESMETLSVSSAVLAFGAGGVVFMLIDIALAHYQLKASQMLAMLSDFIPEALALGAAIAMQNPSVLLLASLIGLQNLPEGFNAYREMTESSNQDSKKIRFAFLAMAFLGPIAAVVGYNWLVTEPMVLAWIMMFASGGILYSVFQDIAPQVPLERHWSPPLGAVAGFSVGIIGHMLTH